MSTIKTKNRMEYPIYNGDEIYWASRDGADHITEFNDFISGLIEREAFDHKAELGVASYIKENGTANLSDKQIKVLRIILSRYNRECGRCSSDIPWSELLDSDGYCSYCSHQSSKED